MMFDPEKEALDLKERTGADAVFILHVEGELMLQRLLASWLWLSGLALFMFGPRSYVWSRRKLKQLTKLCRGAIQEIDEFGW